MIIDLNVYKKKKLTRIDGTPNLNITFYQIRPGFSDSPTSYIRTTDGQAKIQKPLKIQHGKC